MTPLTELTSLFLVSILAGAIRLASPILLTALGEVYVQRSGVLNLGTEGTMLMGAFGGFIATHYTGSLLLGVLSGAITGLVFGIIMGFLCITLRVNQVVSGIGLTILGLGLSSFLYRTIFGIRSVYPRIQGFSPIDVPFFSDVPVVGEIIFHQNAMVYLSLALVPIFTFVLFKTTFGLKVRSVGENPSAADVLGVNVLFIRYICIMIGGIMAGLGGSFLSLAQLNVFRDNITAGRGWIAVAIVMFGKWSPYKVFAGALLFGGVEALQLLLQAVGIFRIPPEFLLMLPYIFTILVLTITARKTSLPAAFTIPYKRGEK